MSRDDKSSEVKPRRATVVVVGDLARSPRIYLHACALAKAGFAVEVFANVETPLDGIGRDRSLVVKPLPDVPTSGDGQWLLRATTYFLQLVRVFVRSAPADVLILQNPPAVHVLPILLLLCRWRGCRLILDWHNFGWTVLGLRLGARHPLVRLAGFLERRLGRFADDHLCVSSAMRRELRSRCGVEATVVCDKPAAVFLEARAIPRATALHRVLPHLDLEKEATTDLHDGKAALVVSATSWSADEDFDLLLGALRLLERSQQEEKVPKLVVAVSGQGRLRQSFLAEHAARPLRYTRIVTPWLPRDLYPLFLAAADLGVCLHRSSSAVDLPMKLADMRGVGVPTCVFDYGSVLREILSREEESFLFSDVSTLVALLARLLSGFPDSGPLTEARARFRSTTPASWEESWRRDVAPLLDTDGGHL